MELGRWQEVGKQKSLDPPFLEPVRCGRRRRAVEASGGSKDPWGPGKVEVSVPPLKIPPPPALPMGPSCRSRNGEHFFLPRILFLALVSSCFELKSS